MPEPLRLDVELGAQGVAAGIREISGETEGLKVSSKKASSAIKSFAHDLANSENASDVASAGLEAFTKILGSSIAATVFGAGAKAIYDAYSEITEAVDAAKKSLEEAYEVTSRGGIAESFAEGVAQAKEFDKVADQINKKIKEINDSPLHNLIDVITGSTDKMHETAALAEQEAIRRREAASAAELQYQTSINGATEEQKAIKQIDKALSDQLDSIDVLKESKTAANLVAIAELKKEAIEQKAATEERQKSEKNLSDVIKERAQSELKAYEAEAKARQDAQKIFQTFEADKAKAHQEELKRSAERISSIEEEIKALQERGDAIRESLAISGGDIATTASKVGGSARGPGQRKTSFEIGMERKAQQAEQEAQREFRKKAEEIAIGRIRKEKGPGAVTDKAAIQRELGVMQKEGIISKTLAPIKEYNDQKKALTENEKALAKNTDQLNESKKSQEKLDAQAKETTATFDGTDYSVNRMGESSDMVSSSLDGFGDKAGESMLSFDGIKESLNNFSMGTNSAVAQLSTLAGAASNLSSIFSGLNTMEISTINTGSIVLGGD